MMAMTIMMTTMMTIDDGDEREEMVGVEKGCKETTAGRQTAFKYVVWGGGGRVGVGGSLGGGIIQILTPNLTNNIPCEQDPKCRCFLKGTVGFTKKKDIVKSLIST
jgi:hypothetical protein